jgi:lysophospholipase L1-like esterase
MEEEMSEKSQFGRLLVILLATWVVCIGMYWLPEEWMGIAVRKVDLLSDIRVLPADDALDALLLEEPDSTERSSALPDDSLTLAARRDSAYRKLLAEKGMTDSLPTLIEDFSAAHTGLSRFFAALNRIALMNRPVRIAFLGDSFIEGDILVADFRARMQARFGGHGVGFVPVASEVEQYRPTVYQRSRGWNTHSLLTDKKRAYVLSGLLFEAQADDPSITFRTVDFYPGLEPVSSVKFLYSRNEAAEMRLTCNRGKDTLTAVLPPTGTVAQYETEGLFTDGRFQFRNARGLQALGVALEDNAGVVVDNFSLRGNSGTTLSRLDESSCRRLNEIRPYDLIVLQYGLNVATEDLHDYGWYREQLTEVVRHVQQCFPASDILLLSVSDRSHYRNGAFRTIPAVVSLLKAQRQTAEAAQVTFWNMFRAMGGENGMVRYVKNRWASRDYTHLSFRGGRELAGALYEALMLEKEWYDKMEQTADEYAHEPE